MSKLGAHRIILGSSSPRRHQLLKSAGITDFEIVTSPFEETVDKSNVSDPASYVEKMACGKARDVWKRAGGGEKDVVVGADTVVYLDSRIYEKPKDEADAVRMLKTLSHRTHTVYTGVCVIYGGGSYQAECNERVFYETTKVKMGDLPHSVIEAYVRTGEPMDKAGAYGIQGTACSSLIDTIEGSYDNVVGFPTHSFCKLMYEIFGRPK